MEQLTAELRSTSLSDGSEELEQLFFNPPADSGIKDTVLDDIPRYLFRVASPRSDGLTNETWVRSESAHQNNDSSAEDIFSNLTDDKRADIAQMLNLHLRWWPKYGLEDEDNFVSWTSSLLFAIQFIYYRHQSLRDGSSLADIKLYVVDTTKFPRGTFMRDLDLMDIFCGSDESLKDLRSLRNGGEYYFGEFLSQGSLKIKDKCQVIPADILFEENRLRRIQPQFEELDGLSTTAKAKWAKEVVRLRKAIWPQADETPKLDMEDLLDRLQAITEIIKEVAPHWALPIAIYLAALIGQISLEGGKFANFNTPAPDTMPEMKQVKQISQEVDDYFRLKNAGGLEKSVSENEHCLLAAEPNEMAAPTGQQVLAESDTAQQSCEGNEPGSLSEEGGSEVS